MISLPDDTVIAGFGHPNPRMREESLRAIQLLFGCLVLSGLAGCDDDFSTGPVLRNYPLHHTNPDWAVSGKIVYEDSGYICYPGGGERKDTSLAGLWVLDPSTGESVRLRPDGSRPSWDPTGSRIVFELRDSIAIMDVPGGEPIRLTVGRIPKWSRSGQWIAFSRRDGVYLTTPDGGGITRMLAFPVTDLGWCTSDTGLVFHCKSKCPPEEESAVYTYSLIHQRVTRLFAARVGTAIQHPTYAPSGTALVYTLHSQATPRLWIAAPIGSPHQLLSSGPGSQPTWSPDGTQIAYVREDPFSTGPGDNILWRVDLATGEDCPLLGKRTSNTRY